MNETNKRLNSCCFTGHRPQKLNNSEEVVKQKLKEQILKAIEAGYTSFITGMAKGVDTYAAEIVIELKQSYNNIKLLCAIPFEGFNKRWAKVDKERYQQILQSSDDSVIIYNKTGTLGYYERDRWMVDHSNLVIAVYNGKKSGTGVTINYAKQIGVDVVIIEDSVT